MTGTATVGYKRLALSVMLSAVKAYHKREPDAVTFIEGPALDFWCKVADIDPDEVREANCSGD